MSLRHFIPSSRLRVALCAAAALVALSLAGGAGTAGAGLSNYPTTLYLSGAASSTSGLGASNTLVTAAGPGQPASAPTATGTATTGVLSGSYSYEYTVTGSDGETAPSPMSGTAVVSSKTITVGNLPTGVTVNLYRKNPTGSLVYRFVTTLTNNASSTYTDNTPDATVAAGSVVPTSENKPNGVTLSYFEFAPRTPMTSTTATSLPVASPTYSSKDGWVVDGGGGVAYPSGTWTFTNKLKGIGGGTANAHLVIGMWVVDASGNAVGSPIIDPTGAGENTSANIATGTGTSSPITTTITGVRAFTVASNQHLYVQFWRRQIAGSGTTTTFYSYDGTTKITTPTPTSMPDTPSLNSVAARVKSTPSFSATYTEPDNNGTVSIELCTENPCVTVVDSATSSTLASGGSFSWTPTATLTNGTTYYAFARAVDSLGNTTAWSTPDSFVYDTSAPAAPTLSTPASAARVNSTQLTATANNTDAGDTTTINFQLCSNSSCSSVVDSGASASGLSNGSSGSWTPAGHADGTYWWRAQDQDLAGNTSGWSATRSFTLDTTAPSTPVPGTTAALVKAVPTLSGTFSDPDAGDTGSVLFQVCSDSACNSVVTSGSGAASNGGTGTWTPTLADGTYWWRAQGQDTAGNKSAWTATQSFTLDTTPPSATLGSVAARTNTTPQLSVTFSDPDASDNGTVSVQLCRTSACTTVLQTTTSGTIAKGTTFNWTPASLADGTYYWRASATDAAGNTSGWGAASSFVVDTVAPSTPTLSSPAASARVNSLALGAGFSDTDTGDSGTVSYQLCSTATCTSVVASGTSSTVANGGTGTWTVTGLADGSYWWRASSTDAAGNVSGWSATRVVTLDTAAPAAPTLGGPADGAYLATVPSLSATFQDADATDSGSITFQVCSDSACSSVVASGSSASGLANNATGSWTPTGLAGGTYYWRAGDVDAAGNGPTWTATHSFTFDGTPPTVPTLGGVVDGSRTLRIPTLTATYADPGAPGNVTGTVLFQVCRTSSCSAPVATTTITSVAQGTTVSWTPAGLVDGRYWFRASAIDAASNQSAWSPASSFVLDTTPPAVPALGLRANAHVPPTPTLSAVVDDPGDAADSLRLAVELCADAGCGSVTASGYSSDVAPGSTATWTAPTLADGTYYWRAAAEDAVGNQSAWSPVQPFVVDTTPPPAPTVSGTAAGTLVRKATLSATLAGTDPTDVGKLEFQVCTDAACTTVVDQGISDTVAAGAVGSWTPTDLGDGSYFWRARTQDEAGNESAWSSTLAFTLDDTPPNKPRGVTATVTSNTLTLRWQPPAGREHAAAYVLLVDGRVSRRLSTHTLVVRVKLHRGDKRTFAIAAVDSAGNVSVAIPVFPRNQPAVRTARVHSAR